MQRFSGRSGWRAAGRAAVRAAAAIGKASVLLLLLASASAAPARADGLTLALPVDCDMQSVCSVQQYFDHDPGEGWIDYTCGRLAYDGHDGIDIRVPDLPTMQRGVAVVAAAPGVVKATRDAMADVSVREIGQDAVRNREAGNGVVIDHGGGWETQYSHLKRGSVVVSRGERVETGQKLGEIGLSGNTEYPHVHFSVRYNGRDMDPFVGPADHFACGDRRAPLWSEAALAQMPYRPTGPLIAGFATGPADGDAARRGDYASPVLPADAPALVLWAEVWGTAPGDVQKFRITGPDGAVVFEQQTTLQDAKTRWFAFSGRKRPAQGWQPGAYQGTYELIRDGETAVSMRRTVTLGG